jgi:hypothetical protein
MSEKRELAIALKVKVVIADIAMSYFMGSRSLGLSNF